LSDQNTCLDMSSQPKIQGSKERYLRKFGKPDPLLKVWNSVDMKL